MGYVTRDIEPKLNELVASSEKNKNVILVEGARQVGKSRLVEHLLSSVKLPKIEANLEVDALLRSRIDSCGEFREFQDLLEDQFGFDPRTPSVVFLDEAQESMKLGGFVRSMKEQWPRTTTVLTGSALSRLFRESTRYPVGRVTPIVVRPFSFLEFLRATGRSRVIPDIKDPENDLTPARHRALLDHLDQYLQVGGLPEVVLQHARDEDFGTMQKQILAGHEQDFMRLFGEDKLHIAQGCLRSVANFVGTPSKNTSVLPHPTRSALDSVKSVFARLEDWHMILRSSQFGSSATASHNYLPKRYLFDTGLLRCLRESAVPSIGVLQTTNEITRTPLGGVMENQVAVDLAAMGYDLSGWKKSPSGMEIDFVVKQVDRTVPVECKATLTLKKTHLKGIIEYLRLHELDSGVVVSFAPFERIELSGGVEVFNIPAYRMAALPTVLG